MRTTELPELAENEPLEWLETLICRTLGEAFALAHGESDQGRAHALSTVHQTSVWESLVPIALKRITDGAQRVAANAEANTGLATSSSGSGSSSSSTLAALEALSTLKRRQRQQHQAQHALENAVQRLYLTDSFASLETRLEQQVRALCRRLRGLDLYTDENGDGVVLTLSSTTMLIDIDARTAHTRVRYVDEHGTEVDDPYAERDIRECLLRGDMDGLANRLQVLLDLEELASEPSLRATMHPRTCLMTWNDALVAKTADAATLSLKACAQCNVPLASVRRTDGLSLIFDVKPLALFVPEWQNATLEQVSSTSVVRKAHLRFEPVVVSVDGAVTTCVRPVLLLETPLLITTSIWRRCHCPADDGTQRASVAPAPLQTSGCGVRRVSLWQLLLQRNEHHRLARQHASDEQKGPRAARPEAVAFEAVPPSPARLPAASGATPTSPHGVQFAFDESEPALWIHRIPLAEVDDVLRIAPLLRQQWVLLDLMESLLPSCVASISDRLREGAPCPAWPMGLPASAATAAAAPAVRSMVDERWVDSEASSVQTRTHDIPWNGRWRARQEHRDDRAVLILDAERCPSAASSVSLFHAACEATSPGDEHADVGVTSPSPAPRRLEIVVCADGGLRVFQNGEDDPRLSKLVQTSRNIPLSIAVATTGAAIRANRIVS